MPQASPRQRVVANQRTMDQSQPTCRTIVTNFLRSGKQAIMRENLQSFGQYDLLGILSNSPTGAIWKARHRVMGRVVALKVLTSQAAATVDFRLRPMTTA